MKLDKLLALGLPEKRAKAPRKRWVPTIEAKAGPCPFLIRWRREAHGLTQRELADKCGLGKRDTSISAIENYQWPVTETRLATISKALGVRPEQLCAASDEEARAYHELFQSWNRDGRPDLGVWRLQWMAK